MKLAIKNKVDLLFKNAPDRFAEVREIRLPATSLFLA